MTLTDIEHRLSVVEEELARLKVARRGAARDKAHPVQTLDEIHGTFANDEAFQEAMRIGRKWRHSQNIKPRRAKVRAKAR
jgi:hypothetical protein